MFQKGMWCVSDIMDLSNLNMLNSIQILIYYGKEQTIWQTYLSKISKDEEVNKIKSLFLGQDMLHEVPFILKDVYNKLIRIKVEEVQFSKAKVTYMTSYKLETKDIENSIYLPESYYYY